MYASIRQYQTTPGAAAELTRRVQEGFVPIIATAPGFIAYYVVNAGDDRVASVSIFQNQAGAEDSNRMAAGWARDHLAELIAGPPLVTAGAVVVQAIKSVG
jgi:heme-degrading monooxygenase HmoA